MADFDAEPRDPAHMLQNTMIFPLSDLKNVTKYDDFVFEKYYKIHRGVIRLQPCDFAPYAVRAKNMGRDTPPPPSTSEEFT